MKKILLIVVLFSFYLFPQNLSSSKQLLLENSIKQAEKFKEPEKITLENLSYSKKNAGLAVLLSALLPGMGELYAGSYTSGKYFTIADGALWGIYIGMNSYSNWQLDRYKSYATEMGSVNSQGKDATYYATIGDYMNIDQYNNAQLLSGNYNQVYSNGYYWKWQTDQQRVTYRNMWYSSEQARNNLRFVVGALIINRIISAINAARLVAQYNKRLADDTSWNMSANLSNTLEFGTSFNLSFQKSF